MRGNEVPELAKRLDVIANLLAILAAEQEKRPSIASRIMVLHQAGLGPADIGRIIGKSTEYVGGVTSQKKKAAMKKRRKPSD